MPNQRRIPTDNRSDSRRLRFGSQSELVAPIDSATQHFHSRNIHQLRVCKGCLLCKSQRIDSRSTSNRQIAHAILERDQIGSRSRIHCQYICKRRCIHRIASAAAEYALEPCRLRACSQKNEVRSVGRAQRVHCLDVRAENRIANRQSILGKRNSVASRSACNRARGQVQIVAEPNLHARCRPVARHIHRRVAFSCHNRADTCSLRVSAQRRLVARTCERKRFHPAHTSKVRIHQSSHRLGQRQRVASFSSSQARSGKSCLGIERKPVVSGSSIQCGRSQIHRRRNSIPSRAANQTLQPGRVPTQRHRRLARQLAKIVGLDIGETRVVKNRLLAHHTHDIGSSTDILLDHAARTLPIHHIGIVPGSAGKRVHSPSTSIDQIGQVIATERDVPTARVCQVLDIARERVTYRASHPIHPATQRQRIGFRYHISRVVHHIGVAPPCAD